MSRCASGISTDLPNGTKRYWACTEQGVEWTFQDHHHFHSIYFNDPDGHHLELTVQVRGL